jgi:hypothetical protein
LDDQLKNIFTNINDWLKFAETKTAALLTGNGLLIFGIIRTLKDQEINPALTQFIYFVLLLLILSLLTCLISFIPSLKLPWLITSKKPSDSDNLLFFGHAAKYNSESYLEKLFSSTENPEKSFTTYEKYYAEQIIVNSIIALRKFRLFTFAIWLSVGAVMTLLLTLLFTL